MQSCAPSASGDFGLPHVLIYDGAATSKNAGFDQKAGRHGGRWLQSEANGYLFPPR
jgi:hypothetical protein